MRKSTGIMIVIILLAGLIMLSGKNIAAANSSSDLNKLIHAAKAQNGKITGWSLYARETFDYPSKRDWLNQVSSLKRKLPAVKWETSENDRSRNLVGVIKHKHYVETIKLVSTLTNEEPVAYLLYEVDGVQWNAPISMELNNQMSKKLDGLFTKKPLIFSCIKGEFNDKIDRILFTKTDRLLSSLKAVKKEALEEKDFSSISAYSPQLSEKIPVKESSMNLQIGLRKNGLGAKTTFVIGTPIITIEY